MKAYYSIVSLATHATLNEQFNIGLLCVTPAEVYFHYSATKFRIVKSLLSDSGANLALSALKGIEKASKAIDLNNVFNTGNTHAISASYLSYLSRYNNNLIRFSAPVEINLAVDNLLFQSLFQKFVFSEEQFEAPEKKTVTPFAQKKKAFQTKAKAYANIDFSVDNQLIDELLIPVKVDVFGKNGAFVSGQTIDFEKTIPHIQQDISSYLYLVQNAKIQDKESKCYVLGTEPPKIQKEQHANWKALHESDLVEFVSLNEAEKVIDYMQRKGVKPVIED